MKKIKIIQTLLVLFVAFTFSNCEEDGEIQFIVVDEFETNASVTGFAGVSTFNINEETDISDLLDNASEFVEADVESVIVTLNDYNDTSISGTFNLSISGATLFSESLTLTAGVPSASIEIPAASSDILTAITSGVVNFDFSGTADQPIADNDFTLNLKFKIRATVQ